ncbi:Haloacid dehalogenase-like hydrolase-domain-containing protein [Mycena rebaudengoi]|nr:Haloacid dehalogenase-like hydrolase-domain-containing protein [Mycena rebaudengoi]
MAPPPFAFNALILDLGDVLFSWSSQTSTSITSGDLKKCVASITWFDYERGRISQEVCYQRLAEEFSLDPREVGAAFEQARGSLTYDHDLADFIQELKSESQGMLKVFAMSNISVPDYIALRAKHANWDIFDAIFTSGAAGERKPELAFYRHVLSETGVDPSRTVFIDDKRDNVLSARSLGMRGINFESAQATKRALRNIFGDPMLRGRQFLKKHARNLSSVTDDGFEIHENFAQLLILEATRDQSLVQLEDHPRTWNFFQGESIFTTDVFPFDLDTTSLALTIVKPDEATVHSVMDEMLEYVNNDGIIQTYFDHRRPRFDPVVCVNILSVFHSHGRGQELTRTRDWVYNVLLNRAYEDGTRYYQTGECFLFFIVRLLQQSDDAGLHSLLKPTLKQRMQELIGKPGDALALVMRVIICHFLRIENEPDLVTLLSLQCEDGGWEVGWIYKYGSSGKRIGNRGLVTALAVNALDAITAENRDKWAGGIAKE